MGGGRSGKFRSAATATAYTPRRSVPREPLRVLYELGRPPYRWRGAARPPDAARRGFIESMAGALRAPEMARHRATSAHRHGGPTAVRTHRTGPLGPFGRPCPRARPPARGRRTRARRSKGPTELPFEVHAQPARGERQTPRDCHDSPNGWGRVGWTQEGTPRSRAHSEITKTRARAVLWWAAGVSFEAWSSRASREAKYELRDRRAGWGCVT